MPFSLQTMTYCKRRTTTQTPGGMRKHEVESWKEPVQLFPFGLQDDTNGIFILFYTELSIWAEVETGLLPVQI